MAKCELKIDIEVVKPRKIRRSIMRKKLLLILMFAGMVSLINGCGSSDNVNSVAESSTKEETTDDNKEDYLEDEIGIVFSKSVRNDTTRKWREAVCSTSEPINNYAYDYYKCYFSSDDEIHFIINFGLKTTNRLVVSGGSLQVTVFEYVEDEEHDAKQLPSGIQLDEFAFDLATGELFSSEPDKDAGTVSEDEILSAVKECIVDQYSNGTEIKDVTVDNGNLTISLDITCAKEQLNVPLSDTAIATNDACSVTDAILSLEDQYLNSISNITVDFGSIGHITCSVDDAVDMGYGKYFEISEDMLTN